MKNKHNQKNCSEDYWKLEDSKVFGILGEIKTTRIGKKETSEWIAKSLEFEKKDVWENIKNEKLDIGILVHLNKKRYKTQDVDNIAKVILDSIKKNNSEIGLITDDSQIIRLLIHKKLRECSDKSDTDQVSISIRKHDPKKDMKLIRSYTLMTKGEYFNQNVQKN
ncbi:MAG: RusA family crossover junction endodeoxyribonuclease [Candidatus Omnitrophota bacterium]|nr:RusA family crossover junction endodeoxyribonuclease [Candidatus Omnitrophota bacterium]